MGNADDEQILAALALINEIGVDIGSQWRHRKGEVYVIIANALRETDKVPLVVYRENPPQGV